MASERPFTAEEKLREIERELKLRRRVYPEFVASGRLPKHRGDQQIAILEAVAEDYRRLAAGERLL